MPEGIKSSPGSPLDLGNPALIGFEAGGAPVENILPVLRSGRYAAPPSEPECRIPLFAAGRPVERQEGVGAPSVSSGPEKAAGGPEIRPSVAAAIPAYAFAA